MIFQDELGSGGLAYNSWGRMVGEHELRAEVEYNAFATVHTFTNALLLIVIHSESVCTVANALYRVSERHS